MNFTVLVTGGAGFIGSHICDKIIEMGYEVKCLDNLLTSRIENIEHLMQNENFEFINGDIRDYDLVNKIMKSCTHVTHQAALGSVPRSIDDPFTTNEINVSGSLNVLISAKNNGIKRFVYASSSSVYGDDPNLPKIETKIGNPLSPYAVTKSTFEDYARTFSAVYGTETIGLRYFNIFGPRQSPEGAYAAVIPKFMESIKFNKSPTIFGDGGQTRDFTYVDNAVLANILALFRDDLSEFGMAFNVACEDSISINKLFECIKEETEYIIKQKILLDPIYEPERAGDVRNSLADLSLINNYIGYKPVISSKEGIKKTVKWYFMGED